MKIKYTKKMYKIIFLLVTMVIFKSCTINGLGDDQKKVTPNQSYRIDTLQSFENLKPRFVYIISGKQLNDELKKHKKALVYIFTNGINCRKKNLQDIENFANENDSKIFFVMDGYMNFDDSIKELNTSQNPFFVINKNYYKKNFKPSYVTLFENDLKVNSKENITYFNTLFYFENGEFIKILKEYSGVKEKIKRKK